MTDYSKTIMYLIKCNDENITDEYVGSTINFIKRKNRHKTCCNNINGKNYNQKIYTIIRANGGWDNWTMIQLEEFPCKNNREAEKRETEIIAERKPTINKNRPFITEEDKKVWSKIYRDNNKDKKKEMGKKYRELNKDKYKLKKSVKTTCECGSIFCNDGKARHIRSEKHIKFMKVLDLISV